MEEIWRDIEEFNGLYQVSNLGQVRSVERYINTRTYPSVIMKQYEHHNGKAVAGARVHLRNPKKSGQIQRSVGKLVLITFNGKPPKNAKQVIHIDGNPLNNRLDNLQWDVDKTFYMEENKEAREMFEKYGYQFVRDWVACHDFWRIRIDFMNVDDLIQECIIAIWGVVDAWDKTHCTFKRFVFIKCDWVFKKLYKKYSRRKELLTMVSIESELVTDDRPLDHIQELSYLPEEFA